MVVSQYRARSDKMKKDIELIMERKLLSVQYDYYPLRREIRGGGGDAIVKLIQPLWFVRFHARGAFIFLQHTIRCMLQRGEWVLCDIFQLSFVI